MEYSKDEIGRVLISNEEIQKRLDELAAAHPSIYARRGMGFMQGLELTADHPVGQVIQRALPKGLIVISAGTNVLRLVPPLIITKDHIDTMVSILSQCLSES